MLEGDQMVTGELNELRIFIQTSIGREITYRESSTERKKYCRRAGYPELATAIQCLIIGETTAAANDPLGDI